MMCWQMCPFPHTCPSGSVGEAGGGGQGGRCQGIPWDLGGQASMLLPHSFTLTLSLWILCHPILPNLSLAGFLGLSLSTRLFHSVVGFLAPLVSIPIGLGLLLFLLLSFRFCLDGPHLLSSQAPILPVSPSFPFPPPLIVSHFPSCPLTLPFCSITRSAHT